MQAKASSSLGDQFLMHARSPVAPPLQREALPICDVFEKEEAPLPLSLSLSLSPHLCTRARRPTLPKRAHGRGRRSGPVGGELDIRDGRTPIPQSSKNPTDPS